MSPCQLSAALDFAWDGCRDHPASCKNSMYIIRLSIYTVCSYPNCIYNVHQSIVCIVRKIKIDARVFRVFGFESTRFCKCNRYTLQIHRTNGIDARVLVSISGIHCAQDQDLCKRI